MPRVRAAVDSVDPPAHTTPCLRPGLTEGLARPSDPQPFQYQGPVSWKFSVDGGARVMMVQVLMTVIKEQQKKLGSSTFHLLVCNPIPDRLGIWRIHGQGGGDQWRALSCYKLSEGPEVLGRDAASPRPQSWWHICESIFISCIFTVISKFLTISKLLWLFIWLIQWVCDSGMVIFFFSYSRLIHVKLRLREVKDLSQMNFLVKGGGGVRMASPLAHCLNFYPLCNEWAHDSNGNFFHKYQISRRGYHLVFN